LGAADVRREVADDDVDRANAERVTQELELAREQRLAAHLQHDLGNVRAARMNALALASGGDDADTGSAHGEGMAVRPS
jgi:hypothetical protein